MFRTELTIAPATGQLARTARVLTMGSCFADSIGTRLAAHKVETRVNPFGTVFQPLALARLLRAAAGEEVDWQQHLVQARGRWQSYDLHGSIGADSPVELLQYIQEVVRQTGEFLRDTDLVLLTLGTAWAHRLRETGELVSNCHKQPADLFVRELLTPDEIINALAETHAYLRRINPELRFVLTVSPVRHLKDTLPLNSVSKSVLRVATHIVSDLLPGVAYFPAFELLTDDLRDYRFYAADMLHPSEVAEDYIWDKFARTYFDADFGRFRKEWAAVRQSLGHRPLHEGAPEHRQFLESTREKLEQLSLRNVDVAHELRTVRARLEALPLPVQLAPVAEPEDDEERIDIGEAVRSQTAESTDPASVMEAGNIERPARGEGRPPRLSPEEFRAQRAARPERARRDGRGKDQGVQPTETEQFQAASFAEADEFVQQPFLTESTAVDLIPVASAAEPTVGGPDEADTEAGRKKKRRSRGGAKRTARKHALRLAAEVDIDESQLAASETALEAAAGEFAVSATAASPVPTENPAAAPEAREPRHNRRNDNGRGIARVPLFAASVAPAADASAEASEEVTISTGEVADSELDVPVSSSRKSRNRKKKKGAQPVGTETADAAQSPAPAQTPRGAIVAVVDQDTLNVPRNNNRRDNHRPQELPVAALPVGGAAAAVAATPVVLVPAEIATEQGQRAEPTAPRAAKPSKRKSRAMVGGRSEKPAIDTPIIPVVDASMVRSQVAAGRLTGTLASLVEPTAPAKFGKTASAPKPAATNSRKASTAVVKALAAGATTTVGSKAPAALVVSAVPLPQSAAPKSVKSAKESNVAASKAPVAPKATVKTAKATTPIETVVKAIKPTAKKVVKAPVATKAAPVVAPQTVSAGKPAGTKPAKKALATAKPAGVPSAKPTAKPITKLVAKPAATAPKVAAVAKPVKLAMPAAEQPKLPKKAASKAAPAKTATAKSEATKTKAPKKGAS